MKPKRTTTGILLLLVAAFVGFLLLYIPPQIVAQYESVSRAGTFWVYVYFSAVGLGAAIFLSLSVWIVWRLWANTRRKIERRRERAKNPSQLTPVEKNREIDENLAAVEDLKSDPNVAEELREKIDPLVRRVDQKRAEQTLEIVAFGTISSGKSSLLNLLAGRDVFQTDPKGGTTVRRNEVPWPGADRVTLVDTPGLGEVDGAAHAQVSADAAKDADLVLVVVDGPLRDSEFRLLARLGQMEKRVLICLNKGDWYDADDKSALLGQIKQQVKDFVRPDDVVAVQAQPAARRRVRVLADGTQQEETVEAPPDIVVLAKRMLQVTRQDGTDLLLANLLLQSRGLIEEARNQVKETLDRRAWTIVDRYMWGAASAAALSPFPLIDIAAGCAISTKMVIDLARVYRQDVDLNVAVNLLGQLGKNLLAILGVSAATPAVASVVGSMLKTIPGAGTIAGGLLQGIVQAIVTRWIGSVFIQYLRNEMQEPEGGLTSLARREWKRVTSLNELRKLVSDARERLSGRDREPDEPTKGVRD